jgi:hypothetical protein
MAGNTTAAAGGRINRTGTTAALTAASGLAFSAPLALMNGAFVDGLALQQFLLCEQGIVLQHCVACCGDMAYEQSPAHAASVSMTATANIILAQLIER